MSKEDWPSKLAFQEDEGKATAPKFTGAELTDARSKAAIPIAMILRILQNRRLKI